MKKIFVISAALLVLAACAQKEPFAQIQDPAQPQDQPQVEDQIVYIEASIDDAAKSVIVESEGAGDFKWYAGDQVAVYTTGGYKISDALTSGSNNKTSATFSFSGSAGQAFAQADRQFFALFPARLAYNSSSELYTDVTASSLKVNLPAQYNLSEVKGNNVPVPMIAANEEDGSLAFKNLCALLRFTLHSVPKQTQYLTFDFCGKKVQGEFALTGVDLSDLASYTGVQTETTTDSDDVITVYNNSVFSAYQKDLIVNIPVPYAADADDYRYTEVIVTTWDGEPGHGGHKINSLTATVRKNGQQWAPSHSYDISGGDQKFYPARKRELYLPVFTINGNTGLDNGTKAVFAPGNLQAILESNEHYSATATGNNKLFAAQSWKFADHQYDAVGAKTPHDVDSSDERNTYSINSLLDPAAGDIVDLFCWIGAKASYFSTERPEKVKYGLFVTTNNSGTSTYLGNTADELLLADWGHNVISDKDGSYPADTWRTLLKTEWDRVIQARKDPNNSNNLIAHGAKGNIVVSDTDPTVVAYGLILLPDHFTYPAGVPELTKVAGTDVSGSGVGKYDQSVGGATCAENKYTIAEWGKMEAAGCIFFPLTNRRTASGTTPYNGEAQYWNKDIQSGKSTVWTFAFNYIADGYTAELPSKTANSLQSGKSSSRPYGCAVRLVRDVN